MERRPPRLDVLALVVAGAVDLLAGVDAGLVLSDGSLTAGGDSAGRAEWIADHTAQWQAGWTFWFVVTTTFAWGFYALARNLDGPRQLRDLAVGVALVAVAVDIVGIVVNIAVVPDLASASDDASFSTAQILAQALTDITAFGLYTLAGLLLLPALFATRDYPRRLTWLGVALWGGSVVATVLLALDGPGALAVFTVTLLLYPVWVWGSARWISRRDG